jgi:4-hydroxy-tetrahydrodipicolinate synthase
VKWALHLMGKFSPELRLPLVQMTEPNAGKLRDELKKLKLL